MLCILIGLSLAGCPKEGAMVSGSTKTTVVGGAEVSFEVDPKIYADKLEVKYRVRNLRKRPLLLLNVLWEEDPSGKIICSPWPFYISVNEKNMLHLSQQILPLPTQQRVEVRIVPFATRLGPGESLEKTFTLPLPLREYNSYFPFLEESKEQQVTTTALVVTLQFVEQVDEMEIGESPLKGALHPYHPQLLALAETVRSAPIPLTVAVMKRQDEFERF
jgi:hypothetical protein